MKNKNTENKIEDKRLTVKTNDKDKISLNSKQIKFYLDANYDAKLKFAKFVGYRIDTSIDLNSVDTAWNSLTETEQNSYINNATNVAEKLILEDKIVYEVSGQEYAKFLESPLATETVATVNVNNAASGQGTSAGTTTGSGGYYIG